MKPNDLVKYRKSAEDEQEEWESQWYLIKDFIGIILLYDIETPKPHYRILWNTGEIIIHTMPPYEIEHFEVISL